MSVSFEYVLEISYVKRKKARNTNQQQRYRSSQVSEALAHIVIPRGCYISNVHKCCEEHSDDIQRFGICVPNERARSSCFLFFFTIIIYKKLFELSRVTAQKVFFCIEKSLV